MPELPINLDEILPGEFIPDRAAARLDMLRRIRAGEIIPAFDPVLGDLTNPYVIHFINSITLPV